MDFIDQLKQFSKRVAQLKEHITTEEATKTSIIMPFFQLLGYDVFNPAEFVPEFTADVGIKKGEKVDYAILQDSSPMILVEAKWCGENLKRHDSQLFRYFGTTSAKFAILTNGIEYKFYTDLDEPNKMDEKPFLEFNLLDIKDGSVAELKKFQKHHFDIETIFNTASELKYSNQIKHFMGQQLQSPTDNFVAAILGEIYEGRRTQTIIEKFRDVVRKSLNNFVNELMNERIKTAIENQAAAGEVTDPRQDAATEKNMTEKTETPRIITSEEELEGFFIVKSLLRELVAPDKITHKDTESYFGVLLDNNTRKWICRLQLETAQKYIIIPDGSKNAVKHPISCIDDIYTMKDKLVDILKRYLA